MRWYTLEKVVEMVGDKQEVIDYAYQHWRLTAQEGGGNTWELSDFGGFEFTNPLRTYRVCENQVNKFFEDRGGR